MSARLGLLKGCPPPSEKRIVMRVTPAAERQLRGGHPWLYDQAIRKQSHEGRTGDLAVVFDQRNKFLAIGLYDPRSPIRVRLLQVGTPAPIGRPWFAARLAAAVDLRAPLERTDTTGYRLVHGENDGLPGLVLDRYETTLVLKLYTAAWMAHLPQLLDAIDEIVPCQRLVLRLSRAAGRCAEDLHGLFDGLLVKGPPLDRPLIFRENGLRFEADPIRGQKTGFFLDQRDNRGRLGSLCAGATVLDAFAYTGGFTVYAAAGGARAITSLDMSRPALEAARRNLALNRQYAGVADVRHERLAGDAFALLDALRRKQRRFDVVVLDPPTFAKTKDEVPAALKSYATLTRLGVGVLAPGGLLVQSSCSGQVSPGAFFKTVYEAAGSRGRRLRELAKTGHPSDHPVRFPEGQYLKCLFARAPVRGGARPSHSTSKTPH